jgi:hypothetical protein
MKHSIRYIEFRYSHTGKYGVEILILRGMEIRSYAYTDKNASRLSLATMSWAHNGKFETAYYPNRIEISRIYPE